MLLSAWCPGGLTIAAPFAASPLQHRKALSHLVLAGSNMVVHFQVPASLWSMTMTPDVPPFCPSVAIQTSSLEEQRCEPKIS